MNKLNEEKGAGSDGEQHDSWWRGVGPGGTEQKGKGLTGVVNTVVIAGGGGCKGTKW